jgi:hypothetical protein
MESAANRLIVDRGFPAAIESQLDTYLQAFLIFAGTVSVYWRVMNKPLTKMMEEWIA